MSLSKNAFQDLITKSIENNERDIVIKTGFVGVTYQAFIVNELHKILEEEIVQVIRDKMLIENFSPKIAESTRLAQSPRGERPGRISWTIISDYTTLNGFPVAVMIEEGRKAYVIIPVKAQVLHWVDKQSGEDVFASKAKIPRFRPRRFVIDTIKEKTPIVQQKINDKTEQFVRDILSS